MFAIKPILFTKWAPTPPSPSRRFAPLAIKMDIQEDAIDALLALSGIKNSKRELPIDDPVLQEFISNIIVNQNAAYRDSKKQCRVHICKAIGCDKIFPSLSRLARHEKVHKNATEKKLLKSQAV